MDRNLKKIAINVKYFVCLYSENYKYFINLTSKREIMPINLRFV